jgi:hypothetical protein
MKFRRAYSRRVFQGFGDDADPTVSIWGDLPFSDPGATLSPVSTALPDNSTNIPGLDQPTAGVSSDSSGMPVVTVTGAQPANSLNWLGWVVALAGAYYLLEAKPR